MVEGLILFLIYLIVVVVVAAIVLWAVARLFPEVLVPARYVIGAICLIIVLVLLLRLVQGGPMTLP